MHELEHSLGLRHGGDEDCNFKPNDNSVMNYRFQFSGIDTDCDGVGHGFLNYSMDRRVVLDEQVLDERPGVWGRRAIDWNWNSILLEQNTAADRNPAGNSSVLEDHDDWSGRNFFGLADVDSAPRSSIATCSSVPRSYRIGDEACTALGSFRTV